MYCGMGDTAQKKERSRQCSIPVYRNDNPKIRGGLGGCFLGEMLPLTIVMICRFPFEIRHQSRGPPMVPVPRMRISRGWAYSAARPKGAENSWCSL